MLSLTSPICRRFCSSSASNLSVVLHSIFRSESDPIRSVSILFSFPNRLFDRYACDHALRSLSQQGSSLTLLDKFLPLAVSEHKFCSLLLSYGASELHAPAVRAFEERVKTGLEVSVLSFNALLSALIKSRKAHEVDKVFREVTEKCEGVKPDEVSYGLLVQALFMLRRFKLAFEKLNELREEKGIVLGKQIYGLLFMTVYKLNNPKLAEEFWNVTVNNGFEPDFDAYKIKVWCHQVRLNAEKVMEVLGEMYANGFKPDVDMYNSLLICHCKNGHVDKAFEVYKAMKEEKGLSLNDNTFNIIMNGLNRAEDSELGIEVFRDSVKVDKIPKFSIVRDFVQLLVKYGKMEEAKEFVIEARKKPRMFNGKIWTVEEKLGQELMVLLFGH